MSHNDAEDFAERLYARGGWVRVGEIPGYALMPRGGLCATALFYRELDGPVEARIPG